MPPQQPSQQQGDNSLAPMWLAFFLFAFAGLIWYLFHAQIVWFLLKISYGEAALVSLFTTQAYPLLETLQRVEPQMLSFSDLAHIVTQVGNYMRYPVALILVTLAFILFFSHPSLQFRRAHTMNTLFDQEKENWPQISPVSKMNLVNIHVDKGPWAMAMTPMQFAKHYRLLYEEREEMPQIEIGDQRKKITVGLLRTEAHQNFAMQLGPYWQGIDALSMHVKALFAVFASRANRDGKSAKMILDQLAISSVGGHLDFSGVDEVLKKYRETKNVKKVTQKHAFVITVMASMLVLAREDGVFASADFLWLKLVDRQLWFMLNAVGRQTPPSEIAGAFSHWLAEKKLGRSINVPMVEEAVKALEIGLKEVVYVPDEPT